MFRTLDEQGLPLSLELDEETRAELGWGRGEHPEDALHPTRMGGNPSRITTGDIDGRHKARDRAALSRAYWKRREAKQ